MTGKPKISEGLVCINDTEAVPEPISGSWLMYQYVTVLPPHPPVLCVLAVIKNGLCIAIKRWITVFEKKISHNPDWYPIKLYHSKSPAYGQVPF